MAELSLAVESAVSAAELLLPDPLLSVSGVPTPDDGTRSWTLLVEGVLVTVVSGHGVLGVGVGRPGRRDVEDLLAVAGLVQRSARIRAVVRRGGHRVLSQGDELTVGEVTPEHTSYVVLEGGAVQPWSPGEASWWAAPAAPASSGRSGPRS